MSIFTHVTVGMNDYSEAKAFYDAVLAELDLSLVTAVENERLMYGKDNKPEFIVLKTFNGETATYGNGVTIGLQAPGPAAVDAFHAAALANGGSCEGPPGPRDMAPGIHAAYVRDPIGNKLCVFVFAGEQ